MAGYSGEGSLGGVHDADEVNNPNNNNNSSSNHSENNSSGGAAGGAAGGAGGAALRPFPEELAHLAPRLQSDYDGFAALVYQLVCVHGAQVTGQHPCHNMSVVNQYNE